MNEPMIAAAKEAEVRAMAARRWPDEGAQRLYAALAESAPRGAWVARDEGTAVGIAFAHELETEWFVSELFVEPGFRGARLGWKLMLSATNDSGDVSLGGVADTTETGTLEFFLRRGMGLHVPLLDIAGAIPKEDDLLPMAAGDYRFETLAIDPLRHAGLLAGLDREVRGSARPADHELFARTGSGTLFIINDDCVGYVYVWPDGRIGPLVSASGAYLQQLFGFALVALRRTYGASWCRALVPGSNVRVLRPALRIGLNIESVHAFASDVPDRDFARYIGFHALAY